MRPYEISLLLDSALRAGLSQVQTPSGTVLTRIVYKNAGVSAFQVRDAGGVLHEWIGQNPNKNTLPARLVRAGHRITWERVQANGQWIYTGRGVVDSMFTMNVNDSCQKLIETSAA